MEIIHQKLHKNIRHGEELWILKYRSSWLKSGDRNTTFFHKKAKERAIRNSVKDILLEDGSKIFDL